MAASHYDDAYFAWQRRSGEFGGWANQTKFRGYVHASDVVIDFGCGGGFLLQNLNCARRIGVEINPAARTVAHQNGIEVYATAAEVPDGVADVILTDNALEHTHHPLDELKALYAKLKPGGRIVAVVPCETLLWKYAPNDVNLHLYSWSPMSLGNLLTLAGFVVLESKPYIHKWPPRSHLYGRAIGRPLFDVLARIYARMARSWFQVKAVALKRQ